MKYFLLGVLLTFINDTLAVNLVTESLVVDALDTIDVSTKNCDFENSTQFYTSDTQFFSYDSRNELLEQINWEGLKDEINKSMENCSSKYLNEKIIDQEIKVSDNRLEAIASNEGVYDIRFKMDKVYRHHTKSRILFGIRENRLVILESHFYHISMVEIQKQIENIHE